LRKRNKILIAVLIILAVLIVAAAVTVKKLEKNLAELNNLPLADINPANIADGVYDGSYKAFPVAVEVKVTVSGQRITAVDLVKHDNGQGKAAEVLPQKVVEAQTLKVDAISGATYSSKVILKAIEDALQKGAK